LAHGANFNFSIWFVDVKGSQENIQSVYKSFISYRESEAVRLCLKHFRQRNIIEPFLKLSQDSGIALEHPSLTNLYQNIVTASDFDLAEKIIERAAAENLFNDYILECKYLPVWRKITSSIGTAFDLTLRYRHPRTTRWASDVHRL
jgi:hypothetical protein